MAVIPSYGNTRVQAAPIPQAVLRSEQDPNAYGVGFANVVQGIVEDEYAKADDAAINKATSEFEKSWVDAMYGEDGLTLKEGNALFDAEAPVRERHGAQLSQIVEGLNRRQRTAAFEALNRINDHYGNSLTAYVGKKRKQYEQGQLGTALETTMDGMLKGASGAGWLAGGALDITAIEGPMRRAEETLGNYADLHAGWTDGMGPEEFKATQSKALRQEYLPRALDAIIATEDDRKAEAFLRIYGEQFAPRDQKNYSDAIKKMSAENGAERRVATVMQEYAPDLSATADLSAAEQKGNAESVALAGLEPGTDEYVMARKMFNDEWKIEIDRQRAINEGVVARFAGQFTGYVDEATKAAARAGHFPDPAAMRAAIDKILRHAENQPAWRGLSREDRASVRLAADVSKGQENKREQAERGTLLMEAAFAGDEDTVRASVGSSSKRLGLAKSDLAFLDDIVKGWDADIPSNAQIINEGVSVLPFDGDDDEIKLQQYELKMAVYRAVAALQGGKDGPPLRQDDILKIIRTQYADTPLGRDDGKVFQLRPGDVDVDELNSVPNIKAELRADFIAAGVPPEQITDEALAEAYRSEVQLGTIEPYGLDVPGATPAAIQAPVVLVDNESDVVSALRSAEQVAGQRRELFDKVFVSRPGDPTHGLNMFLVERFKSMSPAAVARALGEIPGDVAESVGSSLAERPRIPGSGSRKDMETYYKNTLQYSVNEAARYGWAGELGAVLAENGVKTPADMTQGMADYLADFTHWKRDIYRGATFSTFEAWRAENGTGR